MRATRMADDLLQRATGLRLTRPAAPPQQRTVRRPATAADRMVVSPVFVISSVRSGSTLLRVLLDSHSMVHAPVELHLRALTVDVSDDPAEQALRLIGLNDADLEHLLWDRILHRQLMRSGKTTVVDKTPGNAFIADRLAVAWPQARFIHLLRHPVSVAQSWHESDPRNRTVDAALRHAARYGKAVERARRTHQGITVRYEDLVADAGEQTARICGFLGVPWEQQMLEYGLRAREGEFVRGVGDWSAKIRTGRIQSARALPARAEVPSAVRGLARAWGYLDG